jgi:hypothetical protein
VADQPISTRFGQGQWLSGSTSVPPSIRASSPIDAATAADRGLDRACSVDSARGLGKIGTVGSTYFSEIEKVLL